MRVDKVHYDDPEGGPYYTIQGVEATSRIQDRATVRSKLHTGDAPPQPVPPQPAQQPREHSAKTTAALLKLAERAPDAHALFRQIDRDGDGAITTRELASFFESRDDEFAKRLLKAIDTDSDGLIDIDEFKAAYRWAEETREGMRAFFDTGPPEVIFSLVDADKDGRISQQELEAFLQSGPDPAITARQLFMAIDRNGDGLIDRDEFLVAARKVCRPW